MPSEYRQWYSGGIFLWVQKLDALVNQELYKKYKTAPTEEEREAARKEYLDRKGVPEEKIMEVKREDIQKAAKESVQ